MTLHTARFPMTRIGTAGPSLPSSQSALEPDVILPPALPFESDGRTSPIGRQAFTNFANSRKKL
jgi:hypothetical protein